MLTLKGLGVRLTEDPPEWGYKLMATQGTSDREFEIKETRQLFREGECCTLGKSMRLTRSAL